MLAVPGRKYHSAAGTGTPVTPGDIAANQAVGCASRGKKVLLRFLSKLLGRGNARSSCVLVLGMPLERALRPWQACNERLMQAWEHRPFPLPSFDTRDDDHERSVPRLAGERSLPGSGGNAPCCDGGPRQRSKRQLTEELPSAVEWLYRRMETLSLAPAGHAGGGR